MRLISCLQIVDDVHRNFSHTIGSAENSAHGVSTIILVHDVAFGHQRVDSRLLHPRDRRLGMVKGKMGYRHGKLSNIAGRYRLFVHIPNFPANTGREYDR